MAELITTDRDQAFTLWLGVLRDPKSEKMCGALAHHFHTDQRCCLGHACHALGLPLEQWDWRGGYGGEHSYLPARISELLDITQLGAFREPLLIDGLKARFESLAGLNDASNLSPAEIADVIEDMWKNDGFVPYAEDEYDD